MSSKIENLKSKIAALLAKAERTDNEHERDAFNAKAEKLMLAYGIEAAELEAAGEVKPEEIVTVSRLYRKGYALIMPQFIYNITSALGGLRVIQSDGNDMRLVYVVGHKSDVEAAWVLINSLEAQAHSAMKRWTKESLKNPYDLYSMLSGMERYKARRDYLGAFALGAAKRIREERQEIRETASTGAALVLVSKDERLADHMEREHGHLKPAKEKFQGGYTGRSAGYRDGQQANVGTTALGNDKKEIG